MSIERWEGRETTEAPRKHYARFCRKHNVRLHEDSLDCPIGHEIESKSLHRNPSTDDPDLEEFDTREVPPPMGPEQAARHREALCWAAGLFDAVGAHRPLSAPITPATHRIRVLFPLDEDPALFALKALFGSGDIVASTRAKMAYRIDGLAAVRLLLAIRPFLRARRVEVDKLLTDQVE